jgi:hypothetical protein
MLKSIDFVERWHHEDKVRNVPVRSVPLVDHPRILTPTRIGAMRVHVATITRTASDSHSHLNPISDSISSISMLMPQHVLHTIAKVRIS